MEQHHLDEKQGNTSDEKADNKCINCGSLNLDKDSITPLCFDCRQGFIKFPIPFSIKIFAGVIGAVVLFAMIRLPENISLGMHQAKGEKAMKQRQYHTSEKEFKKVVSKAPNYIEAQANLALASFYNQDFETMFAMMDKLGGKEIEDRDLLDQLNEAGSLSYGYFPEDSFKIVMEKYADSADGVPEPALRKFIAAHPSDQYALLSYASLLFDKEEYNGADSILKKILQKDATHFGALVLMTSLKRENNQPEESLKYCDQILSLNKESVYGLSSKARTLLKLSKDKEALTLAQEAEKIEADDPYNTGTLALAYHFNNRLKERDEVMAKGMKDSLALVYMQFPKDIIENKIKFR